VHENRQSGSAARRTWSHRRRDSLREVAALLAGGFRGTDIIARLGESQFAALAVDAAEPSAPVLCQRMESALPCSIAKEARGVRWNFEFVHVAGLSRRPLPSANSWTVWRRGCGFRRFHLPRRLHPAGRSMRLRKDDSKAAIAAKSCLAIRRLWLTVNPLPPRAAFTFSNPRGVQ